MMMVQGKSSKVCPSELEERSRVKGQGSRIRFFGVVVLAVVFNLQPSTFNLQLVYGAEFDIGEIAVTADKGNERNVLSIPADITIITSEDIAKSNAHTISDLLRSEAGVVIRDMYGNGGQTSVDLRGFGEAAASNCIILIDGRRINNIDMANPDISQISLAQVERIEVQKGSASVLYGDGATGGVVNIITKKPKIAKLNIFSSFDAFNSADLRFGVKNNLEKASLLVNASHKFSSGYRWHSEMQATDIGARIKADESNDFGWDVSANYHQDNYQLPGGIYQSDWDAGNYWKAYTWAGSMPVDYGSSNDWYSRASVSRSVCGIKTETEFSLRRRTAKTFMDSYFMSPYDSRFTTVLGAGEKLSFTLFGADILGGIEYYNNSYNILPENRTGDPTAANDDQRLQRCSTAGYIQLLAPLFNIVSLECGARTEGVNQHFIIEPTSDIFKNEVLNAFYAGVNWEIQKSLSSYLKWAKSYRLPKTDEYYTFGTYNSALRPQINEDVECGIKYGSEKIMATISLFITQVKDEIYLESYPAKPATLNENAPNPVIRQGGEAKITVKPFNFITLSLGYALTDAKYAAGTGTIGGVLIAGKAIPLVPMHKGNVKIDAVLPLNVNVGLNCVMVSDRWFGSDYIQTGNMLPGYTVVDMNFWRQFGEIRVFGAVTNICDTRYAETAYKGYYYPSPPRNYQLGVDINL